MLVTPFCLMLACIQVNPDRSQFFRYGSISLNCEDPVNSTGWKVKRRTSDGGVRPCSSGWGFSLPGSTCIIGNTYPTDTGLYWCESDAGETSNEVNITITDRSVILESPAMPVSEGSTVVLYCKAGTSPSKHKYDFFKDGRIIRSNCSGEMTILNASKSDEGLYTCTASSLGASEGSWLTVLGDGNDQQIQLSRILHALVTFDRCLVVQQWLYMTLSTSSFRAGLKLSIRVWFHLIVGIPYLLSTILLGLIYRDRRRVAIIAAVNREKLGALKERIA